MIVFRLVICVPYSVNIDVGVDDPLYFGNGLRNAFLIAINFRLFEFNFFVN